MRHYLLKSSAAYTLISAVQPLLSMLLLPFITRQYAIAQYGEYAVLISIVMLFSFLSGAGVSQSMSNFHFNYLSEKEDSIYFTNQVVTAVTLFNIPILFLTVLFHYLFNNFIVNIDLIKFLMVVLAGLSDVYIFIYIQKFKNERRINKTAIVLLANATLTSLFQIIALIFHADLIALIYCKLLSNIAVSAYCLTSEKFAFESLKLKVIRPAINFGIKMLPWMVVVWAISFGDRLIINSLSDSETVSWYAIALTLASLIQVVYTGIGSAILPIYQVNSLTKSQNEFLPFVAVHVSGIIFFLIILFAQLIEYYLGPKYYGISQYILPASFAISMTSATYAINAKLIADKKPTLLGINNTAAGVIYLALILVFKPTLLTSMLWLFVISKIIAFTLAIAIEIIRKNYLFAKYSIATSGIYLIAYPIISNISPTTNTFYYYSVSLIFALIALYTFYIQLRRYGLLNISSIRDLLNRS
jgi:O-antigen/teichoic acid export membrane protein